MIQPTYRVVLTNPANLRLTLVVGGPEPGQPGEKAEARANADPEHRKHGPWIAASCERHS